MNGSPKAKASEFIAGEKPIHILNNCHEIVLDESRIKKHPKTTQEIVECCKDIRVLGVKELRSLKKWREILKADFEKAAEKKAKEAKKEVTDEKNAETEMGDSGKDPLTLRYIESCVLTIFLKFRFRFGSWILKNRQIS